jgi:hypothetical protein
MDVLSAPHAIRIMLLAAAGGQVADMFLQGPGSGHAACGYAGYLGMGD